MKKAYFQYYETFESIIEKIKDTNDREYIRASIINYGLHGIEPDNLTELQDMAWTICKDLIDQQHHRREVNAANRKKQPAEIPEADETPLPITPAEIENINLEAANGMSAPQIAKTHGRTVAEIKEHLPKAQRFIKPTIEEIAAEIKEKCYAIDAQTFFNYYEANGWKVGRAAMKNWRAALQNWNARDKKKTTGTIWTGSDAQVVGYEDLF